jgi:hypothetical protein
MYIFKLDLAPLGYRSMSPTTPTRRCSERRLPLSGGLCKEDDLRRQSMVVRALGCTDRYDIKLLAEE